MQEVFIDTSQQLAELCEQLDGAKWLALDTEFIRERSYHAQLCLIQVCDGQRAAAVDVLSLDWQPLLQLICRDDILKVFHSARQDLEILLQAAGFVPGPVFDTQLAATLLGYPDQIGYGDLVAGELGITLDKAESRTDWRRRPLSEQQLRYALDDVIHLAQIFEKMSRTLRDAGRLNWLEDEFQLLTDPALYRVEPREAWRKVKGRNRLRGRQLAILRELADWREQRAVASDRPRRWILKDEVLVDLARRAPKELSSLSSVRGLDPGVLRNSGEVLLSCIRRGQEVERQDWPKEKAMPTRLDGNQQAQVDLLQSLLVLAANEAGIASTSLAGRRELEMLVSGERDLELLKGWRKRIAGARLLELLEGAIGLGIAEGKLITLPLDTT